jgi:hypothetical protein
MANMYNGEKRRKTEHISVNNKSNIKKIWDPFFLYYIGWIKPKTISCYSLFKYTKKDFF